MAERSRGWTLWPRSGYRGPSEHMPQGVDSARPASPGSSGHTMPQQQSSPAGARDTTPGPPHDDGPARAGNAAGLIDQIIAERSVYIEYQPVHDFERGQVVAFEALSRGPEGPLGPPQALF